MTTDGGLTVFLYKMCNNKYVNKADSFIKNVNVYGFKNAVGLTTREKNKSYKSIINSFNDTKSLKMIKLIEDKAGKDLHIETAFDMGYCLFGPVIYDFVQWIYNNSYEFDELWFLSREGWVLKKAYEIYAGTSGVKKCESRYFLTSRRAASIAAVRNKEDIKEILCQYYKGGVKNLLSSRLGYEFDNDFIVEMPKDIEKVMKLIDTDDVIEKAEKERKSYINYIGEVKLRTAVVDVGYSGTIQYYLSKLMKKRIDGIYLCSHFNNKPKSIGCDCKSLFPVYNILDERENKIFKNQLYFEAVLQAPFGQLIKFNEKFQPVYNNDNCLKDEIKNIQSGIFAFIEEMGRCESAKRNTFSVELFDYGINSKSINKKLFDIFSVEDSYCSDGHLVVKNNVWSSSGEL